MNVKSFAERAAMVLVMAVFFGEGGAAAPKEASALAKGVQCESCAGMYITSTQADSENFEVSQKWPFATDVNYANAVVDGYDIDLDRGHWHPELWWNRRYPLGKFILTDAEMYFANKYELDATGFNRANYGVFRWARPYVWDEIRRSRTNCSQTIDPCAAARHTGGGKMEWFPNFFQRGVADRAGTLVHEARHHEDGPHTAGSQDQRFTDYAAHAFHLMYLRQYVFLSKRDYGGSFNSTGTSVNTRCEAVFQANGRIALTFVERPVWLTLDMRDCGRPEDDEP
ncbi:MAG: hypothetical protein AAGA56_04900 [Myxococcota bacterium]